MNKILAIAINDYNDPKLNMINNCKSDLEKIIKVLTDEYQFDDLEFVHEKKDTTGENLYSILNNNILNALEGDSLLIIFAGHGEYNGITGSSYWQPSDASQKNPISWLNLSEVTQMMKVSNASHINIISDSCFSGAIFEPASRGGGIGAFENKKSRTALTSGGIEKVSDGKDGGSSPFTEALLLQLTKNVCEEIPFVILANDLVIEFSKTTKQTPKFGGLTNVGHDGGSLILRRRSDNVESHKKELQNLQSALATLVINNDNKEKEIIKQIEDVKFKKNEVIRSQQYEDAAELRDTERKLLISLNEALSKRLEDTYLSGVLENTIEGLGKELDDSFDRYTYSREKAKELYEKIKKEDITDEKDGQFEFFLLGQDFRFQFAAEEALEKLKKDDPKITLNRSNPNKEFWEVKRISFVRELSKGPFELMKAFGVATAGANNIQIKEKKETLKLIFIEIHDLHRQAQFDKYEQSFDDLVRRKSLEVELLNWLREI